MADVGATALAEGLALRAFRLAEAQREDRQHARTVIHYAPAPMMYSYAAGACAGLRSRRVRALGCAWAAAGAAKFARGDAAPFPRPGLARGAQRCSVLEIGNDELPWWAASLRRMAERMPGERTWEYYKTSTPPTSARDVTMKSFNSQKKTVMLVLLGDGSKWAGHAASRPAVPRAVQRVRPALRPRGRAMTSRHRHSIPDHIFAEKCCLCLARRDAGGADVGVLQARGHGPHPHVASRSNPSTARIRR